MFQWDKSISALHVADDKVLQLLRSMRHVQLALPGQPVQESTAYLCQYQGDKGVVTAAVFHLEKSRTLAFYFSEPREVAPGKADSMLDQGMNFVESMGFLLADMDMHLLAPADRTLFWGSLPLRQGLGAEEPAPAAPPAAVSKPAGEDKAAAAVKTQPAAAAAQVAAPSVAPIEPAAAPPARPAAVKPEVVPEKPAEPAPATPAAGEPAGEVDDLLAAVSALRASRPGLRARKAAPTPEELERRRRELRENIGRILASL